MKPTPCEHCGAPYHQPYEDGLVECRGNLRDQRDDARDMADMMAKGAVRDAVREIAEWLREQPGDDLGELASTIEGLEWATQSSSNAEEKP